MNIERIPTGNRPLEQALSEVEEQYVAARPRSREFHERSCRHMPGGNTRTILHHDPFPVALVGGEGAYLEDIDGHVYADFLNEYSAGLYGHSNPAIKDAVKAALEAGFVLGGRNLHEVEFAELLSERFPSCSRLRFCNSGTEANLMALSLARAATGRTHVLVMESGYHGGLLSFAGGGSPLNVPYPYLVGSFNDLAASETLIKRHRHELAAVIVEPMMGGAGCIAAEADFLTGLRDVTSNVGTLLIFDEVMTSRLSPSGLQGRYGVTPDLTSFGKYMGGGMTFGAFGGRNDLMMMFDPQRPDGLAHSGTYNNNVLTMAAGTAGLKLLTVEAIRRLNENGEELRRRLADVAERIDVPLQATGLGSIFGLHIQRQAIRRPTDINCDPRIRRLLHLGLLNRGIYIAPRGYVTLSLETGEREMDRFAEAFEDLLAEQRSALLSATDIR